MKQLEGDENGPRRRWKLKARRGLAGTGTHISRPNLSQTIISKVAICNPQTFPKRGRGGNQGGRGDGPSSKRVWRVATRQRGEMGLGGLWLLRLEGKTCCCFYFFNFSIHCPFLCFPMPVHIKKYIEMDIKAAIPECKKFLKSMPINQWGGGL